MKRRTATGFLLVELLVAIGIIALLATIGTIAATSFSRKAKVQKTHAFMDMLMSAILTYQESTGTYPNPTTNTWNQASNSSGHLYYILKNDPATFNKVTQMPSESLHMSGTSANGFVDAWGNWLYYNAKGGMGGTPALWSAGADGVGTGDAVTQRSSSYDANPTTNSNAKDDVYSYHK